MYQEKWPLYLNGHYKPGHYIRGILYLMVFFLLSRYSNEIIESMLIYLRTDSCDGRRIYISKDISGPKEGTYMFNTSPKSSDFPMIYGRSYLDLILRKNYFKTYIFTFICLSKISHLIWHS